MADVTKTEQPTRPLEGCRVGISISESEELASHGLTPEAINIITVDLARRIMALGGSVLLGHDWRTGGVMEAVARFAISYAGQNAAPSQKLIINYLAEPDQPNLSASDRQTFEIIADLRSISWEQMPETTVWERLSKVRTTWPDVSAECDLRVLEAITAVAETRSQDPQRQRKLALTAMRYFLADSCDVRIVLGGKTLGYQGLAPGIVEEAWWQLLLEKRLVVCEGMGGAALSITNPESPQVKRMQNDVEHPLARHFLDALHVRKHGEKPASVRVVKSSRVEAILRALLP